MVNNIDMIVITGAAGFIGSYITGYFNKIGYSDIMLVDDFTQSEKSLNYIYKSYKELVDRDILFDIFKNYTIDFVFHLGARTDTSEMDVEVLGSLNTSYTKTIWDICTKYQIPLIYASSAATYGNGGFGFTDDIETTLKLKPLNPYGESKHIFDLWALDQKNAPPYWVGL